MDEICHDFQHDIEDSVPKAIAQKILNNLFNQKASGQFCDVQFLHGSATLWAHSCVLASYSPYMMRLFNKYAEENVYWSFNKPMQVNISSVSKCNGSSRNNCVDCTCKIIDFIYTGKIKLDPEHLDHVVNLSNNLEIDVLLLICQRYKRDHYSLLDSLPESNQISTGIGCENTVDFKAYVDNLNNSISYSFYLSSEKCELTTNLKSKSDIDSTFKISNKRFNSDIISYDAKRSSNQVDFRQYNPKSKSNEQFIKAEGFYICPSCNFRSDNNDKLKLHQKVFHRRNYICLECEYTSFKMGEVIDHAIKNSHGGNTCTVCLYEADSFVALKAHLNEHNRIYPFRCTMCKQRFKYRNDWIRHIYSPFHRNDLPFTGEKTKLVTTRILEEIPKPIVTSPAPPQLPPPQPEENKPNHACRICKYEFSCVELLQKHTHIFHKRKYICLSCDFNTFKIELIIEHLMEIRHEENVCSICLFVANSSSTLKEHILDHKNPQPFTCTVCSSRFQTRNEWWRHELAHGSDKPFKCHYCDQSFPTSSYLNTHIIYRHKQKKHKCKVCGYRAPFASKLEKHSLIHRNKYKCKVNNCTFSCSSEVLLKKHKKVHVIKPLSCPICSLKFKFVKNMKRHLKLIHNSKDVMLKCPTCDYSNSRIDKMKDHCRNSHDNDKNILEKINKQYEEIKHYDVPEAVKKRRSHSAIEKINSNINVKINEVQEDKQIENSAQTNKESENNFVCGTVNDDSLKQTVLLSESTGELNIMCENDGKPIPVASVTSTNMLTIGNFREGTGTVTLNETTGVLTFNNINMDSKGAVFLNESTGVLSYINLNIENTSEPSNETEEVRSEQVQLNEVTGEIITVTEDNPSSNKNINPIPEEDFPFDSFGFDFNEDSYDGFDEFDNLFFDTFSPIDQSSSNVEDILKNNTNGLFGEHTPRLDEMTGELTFNKDCMESNHENIWSSVNSFPENSIMESVTTEVYETLLNEVTGEFS